MKVNADECWIKTCRAIFLFPCLIRLKTKHIDMSKQRTRQCALFYSAPKAGNSIVSVPAVMM